MIRSYVVTFAFVTYRALGEVMKTANVGAGEDRSTLLSWICWSVPLLITEVVLQGRSVVRAPHRPLPPLPD
jgi:hypothetical protein